MEQLLDYHREETLDVHTDMPSVLGQKVIIQTQQRELHVMQFNPSE